MSRHRDSNYEKDDSRADDTTMSDSVVWIQKARSCRDCCLFTLVILTVILCVVFFLIVGPLMCFLRMKRFTRVIILWFWLTLASIVVGMVLAFDVYVPVAISGAGREQRVLSKAALSTLMCEGVQITSTNTEISSFIFDGEPTYDDKRWTYTFPRRNTVYADDYQSYPFYLLNGSAVHFYMNTTSTVTFFLIRGRQNFSHWTQNFLCDGGNCFEDFSTVERDLNYKFNTSETNIYTIAFAKTRFNDPTPAKIAIDFDVMRTTYNVTSALKNCTGINCHFDFRFMSDETVLLEIPSLEHDYFEVITTKCVHRSLVYLVAFLAAPLAIGIIVNLIVWFGCKRCEPEDDNEVIPIKSGLRAAGDMARRYSTLSIGRTVSRRTGLDDTDNLNKNIHINEDSRESSWPA